MMSTWLSLVSISISSIPSAISYSCVSPSIPNLLFVDVVAFFSCCFPSSSSFFSLSCFGLVVLVVAGGVSFFLVLLPGSGLSFSLLSFLLYFLLVLFPYFLLL